MGKPEINSRRLIIKAVLVLVLGVLGLTRMLHGYYQTQYIRALEVAGTRTVAIVVKIDEEDDTESGTSYYPHIQYRVNGKSYTQRVDYFGDSSTKVGDTVEIIVDPYSPQSILGQSREDLYFSFLFGCALLGLCGMAGAMRTRSGWCESFGVSEEMIHKELLEKLKQFPKWLGWLLGGVIMAVGCGYANVNTFRTLIVVIPALLYGCVGMYRTIIAFSSIIKKNYTAQRGWLQSKDTFSDSEGSTTYYLTYRTKDQKTYRIKTKPNTYHQAEIGDEILSVFIPGGKKPYINIFLHDLNVQ